MADRVLITGGAGYLGSILCEHLLHKGFEVTVLDNLLFGEQSLFHLASHPNFDFIYGDARDEETAAPSRAGSGCDHPAGRHRRRPGVRPRSPPDPQRQRRCHPPAQPPAQPAATAGLPDDEQRLRHQVRRRVLHGRQRSWSRFPCTVRPRCRPRRRCSIAPRRSRCGWPRCSGCRRACGSICWSTTSSTKPSPPAIWSSSRKTSNATSSISATWPTASFTASRIPSA